MSEKIREIRPAADPLTVRILRHALDMALAGEISDVVVLGRSRGNLVRLSEYEDQFFVLAALEIAKAQVLRDLLDGSEPGDLEG